MVATRTTIRDLTHGVALVLCCLLSATQVRADGIAVITHPDNPLLSITDKQLSDLYLGRRKALPGGVYLELYGHPGSSDLRQDFFRRLNGMSLPQVNAYWARLQFTGRVFPPVSLSGNRELIETVSRNRNALAYVDGDSVTPDVKVIHWLR